MPTLTWLIETLWVRPVEGSLTDVVVTAAWRCNSVETIGTGDEAKTYTGTAYGSCSFAPPTGSFTPYLDLEPEQVLGWCYVNGVDKTAIEANVSLQIENQINPPVVVLPLPWVPQPLPLPWVPQPLPLPWVPQPLPLPWVPQPLPLPPPVAENVATADSIVDAPSA